MRDLLWFFGVLAVVGIVISGAWLLIRAIEREEEREHQDAVAERRQSGDGTRAMARGPEGDEDEPFTGSLTSADATRPSQASAEAPRLQIRVSCMLASDGLIAMRHVLPVEPDTGSSRALCGHVAPTSLLRPDDEDLPMCDRCANLKLVEYINMVGVDRLVSLLDPAQVPDDTDGWR